MKEILYVQLPKIGKAINGSLSANADGRNNRMRALFFDESGSVRGELYDPMIKHISPDGIYLTGFEPAGIDRHRREKFVYQEWWIMIKKRDEDEKAVD